MGEVPAVQGQIVHLFCGNDRAQFRCRNLELFGGCVNANHFCLRACRQRHVNRSGLTHGQNEFGDLLRAEARGTDFQGVATRVNFGKDVRPRVIGDGVALDAGIRIMQSNRRFCHDRTRRVANNAVK